MPEGPEIRLAADKIAQAVAHQPIKAITFQAENLKPFEAMLTPRTIIGVESHGKAMLTRFDNGWNIYSHNQLYGVWMVRLAYDYPDTNRQLRLAIHTQQKSALLYSATDIEVLPDEQLADHPFLSKLGPDLLDPAVTLETVIGRFMDKRFHRRRLGTLLLDQHFLAGLGNYLRSEVLFVARMSPSHRPADCSDEQIQALAEAALHLTRQSYQTKGITNDLQVAEQLKAQGHRYSHYRFWLFNRAGQPCYRCGQEIVQQRVSGRRLYICPLCQAVA